MFEVFILAKHAEQARYSHAMTYEPAVIGQADLHKHAIKKAYGQAPCSAALYVNKPYKLGTSGWYLTRQQSAHICMQSLGAIAPALAKLWYLGVCQTRSRSTETKNSDNIAVN